MNVTRFAEEVRRHRRSAADKSWGLVPTMGALHAGHLSLVNRARADNERVAVSVFVNPAQFNDARDLQAYPRDLDADLALLEAAGVHVVWTPSADSVYPPGYDTYVQVEQMTRVLEGAYRADHFKGVTTVVNILLNVFQPTRAYFGKKDAQQLAVVKRMVSDLMLDTSIVGCPTVREQDGLAMSSRNKLLSPEDRAAAPIFYRALRGTEHAFRAGTTQATALRQLAVDHILSEPRAQIEYISIADPATLLELQGEVARALVSGAVYFGGVRLIDNIELGD